MTSMNRTTTMKAFKTILFAALLAMGCSEFEIENKTPVATATVLVNGAPADLSMPIPYMGTPLTITLDGSASTDEDGSITKYLWLRTGISPQERHADSGMPMFPYPGDPMAVASPQVPLGEGEHQYSLWVTDNENIVSDPATVAFTIETPTTYMPNMACLDGYMNDSPGCEDCVCSPGSTGGCLEVYQTCFENTDPMFQMLCTTVVNCALTNNCIGSACYSGPCMAEITAAAAYMGGDVLMGSCSAMPSSSNPCAAASALGACVNTVMGVPGICADACAD